jgi:peptide/nickel transport system permease protein
MGAFLLRRLLLGAVVVAVTGVMAYGGFRLLRPDLFPGQSLLGGIRGDLDRALLHLDFGDACMYSGCPPVHDLWASGIQADVWLMTGGLLLGAALGVAGGAWCAIRPRSLGARALEWLAMLLFCMPVYVVGLGLLLLFAPPFGIWQFGPLFELHQYISPFEDPVTFLRAMIVPWVVLAAPVAAVCLRLTLAAIVEVEHEDYVRTALAKGLSRRLAVRRHAAPSAYVPVASYVGASIPLVVSNLVLVEIVFSVPGFFRHTKRAIAGLDIPTLQALALWGAVFIVAFGLLADVVIARVDPRIRASGRLPG